MNRRKLLLGVTGLGGAMVTPAILLSTRPAEAVTPQTQMQPFVQEDSYPSFEKRYSNMPGTNFRAARPEEYPRIFGGDCALWRRGRTLYRCEDFYPRKRRNPAR
jgi:hypothetical protein